MKAFVATSELTPINRSEEHGGEGPIRFLRLLGSGEFESALDFVDFTTVPPGSSIGRHVHEATEEIYYVVSGSPLIAVEGERRRLSAHDVAIVRNGQSHELQNDTPSDVTILVVQARIA
ncbi:MAG TPA: cupin domain-containing protein [Candidatus Baltobacteraceae bacterium]|nr:cupin domain-containing protein [Candidatus Baltobacteraceae bacterium]